MDLYGPLLTERQRDFVRLHYDEDLSFGEIAREFGISRQAVHDAVKHAERALESYDRKLGLTPGQTGRRHHHQTPADEEGGEFAPKAVAVPDGNPPPAAALTPSIDKLSSLIDRLERSGGVMYNVDGVVRELREVHDHLKGLSEA